MLIELLVKGFGIIDQAVWKPGPGLNIITGETGAGKSLVVDAVEALLSGQVSDEDIRYGDNEARIEGIFRINGDAPGGQLINLLEENSLDVDSDELIISLQSRRQGRTTSRVSGQVASRDLLKNLGAELIDIHGQSGHLSLLNRNRHLDFLDKFGHTEGLRLEFGRQAGELFQAVRECETLKQNERDLTRQIELLDFQIDEIRRVEIQPGEEDSLQRELTLLTSAEKLKTASQDVYRIISGDDSMMSSASALERLNEALTALKSIAGTDPSWQDRLDYLEGMSDGLAELSRDVRSYGDNLDYDPHRIEEIENRLENIRTLKRKYGGQVSDVLDYLSHAIEEREGLFSSSERREQLEKNIDRLHSEMGALAFNLSEQRHQVARNLAAAVQNELADIGMSHVIFEVSINRETDDEGLPFSDDKCYRFSASGADSVEFLAATNPGEPLKPLAKIASTGEISRFMLALKCALARADTIPVLIFDEIDIGVGGRSGEIIGRKLWNLSRNHQVICVTHLPQIAAFADAHFYVSKREDGERTSSNIIALDDERRTQEIAAMISGSEYTTKAVNAAVEIIRNATAFKKTSVTD